MRDDNENNGDGIERDERPTEDADGDVSFEPEDNEAKPAGFGKSPDDRVGALKEKLERAERERKEFLDDLQRMKAEFANLRKRDEDEKRELVKFANANLVSEMLPVLDSFEMAFGNEAWQKADKNWRTGVEYIHSQLLGVLKQNGIEEISPSGQAYDPMRDEAVERVAAEKEEDDGKVVAVLQKGYRLNGKEIRSPRVRVAEFKKDS